MHIRFMLLILFLISFTQCKSEKIKLDKTFPWKKNKVVLLSSNLKEISGICFSKDGKLFGHDDEIGIVYQINPIDGKIIKKFQLGERGIEADFEDIAIANDRIYLITSKGILFEFSEGVNLEKVEFKEIDLGFSSSLEIEGMCYDPITNSLLIAFKNYSGKENKKLRKIYSFNLGTNKLNKTPRFLLSIKELKSKYGIKKFFPSAITHHSKSGNFFILSSKGGSSIIEIDSKGNLVNGWKLNNKTHQQPEGLTFDQNGNMLISDESVDRPASITIYKIKK